MRRRQLLLVPVLLLLIAEPLKANNWVWGKKDKSTPDPEQDKDTSTVSNVVGSTAASTDDRAREEGRAEDSSNDIVAYTETSVNSIYTDEREARRVYDEKTYNKIYEDPTVQKALQSGNDTEARFFIRDKLCKLGLVDCEDDLLPYGPRPLSHPGYHRPSGPLDNLLYVQPVKVAAHGPPVAAVPLGPGQRPPITHHRPSPGAYSPPIKSHYRPPKPSYTPPKTPYHQPKPVYGAPKPTYNPPKLSYGPPSNSYSPPKPSRYTAPASHSSNYRPPVQQHNHNHNVVKQPTPSSVLHQHVHHHTHYQPLHNGLAGVNRAGVDPASTASLASSSNGVRGSQIGSGIGGSSLGSGIGGPFRGSRNEGSCVCVAQYACSPGDVVDDGRLGRGQGVDLSAISPRHNRRSNISAIDGRSEIELTEEYEQNDTAKQVSADGNDAESNKEEKEQKKVSRRKRNSESEQLSEESLREIVRDIEGRQLGYRPTPSGCLAAELCCRNPVLLNPHRRQSPDTCGVSRAGAINGRISNYDPREGETYFGEFPWQVAILKKDGLDSVYVCGGTLFNGQFVITAAHCVEQYDRYSLTVRMGEWDVNNENEFYQHVESDISALYIHPEYQKINLFNDIAVLRLSTPPNLANNPHIGSICLPDRMINFDGQRCWASGWGKDAFGQTGNFQNVLKKVSLPVIGNALCERQLRRTKLGYSFHLHDGFLCAGGERGKDACKGDGGGPLVCHHGNGFHLAGVVSWGVGCGQPDVPGVYVKVSEYLPWIESITQSGNSYFLGRTPELARNLKLEQRTDNYNRTEDANRIKHVQTAASLAP